MPTRGLIVGKFYPPHRGHKFLIDSGLAQCDELHVIVCQKPHESPSGDQRAAWLREIHPRANVLLIDDRYDENDSRVWASNCRRWLGFAPELVFTSEHYGEPFAQALGCRHVQVDFARANVPISGTRVRTAPLSCWEYLEPPVRAFYARRVVITGAESTGKTTLAQTLAMRFKTEWVPEYGRAFSEEMLARDGAYHFESADFEHIARTQCDRENNAARRCNKVLICDTDAFATSLWHRRYMNSPSPAVEKIAADHPRPALCLLSKCDTPFVQDGTRDGEHIREWMHAEFERELAAHDRPFVLLEGSYAERTARAIAAVEALLNA
jgi:HTH-type transcriptional regulator, transcriptional repressor of NAD biosynthesis genes